MKLLKIGVVVGVVGVMLGGVVYASQAAETPNAAAAAPIVGVNYNGLTRNVDQAELDGVGPTWVRGFVDMRDLLGKSAAEVAADPDIAGIGRLNALGYHTVVSLKWRFEDQDFPAPGSDAMESYFTVMRRVLDATGPRTGIVVVGNEPFRETKPAFRDADMVWFYERMATEINTYRTNHGRTFALYMGSFNNVYDAAERTATLNSLVDFASATSWIAGVDLHVHHDAAADMTGALSWTRSRVPAAKKIIVTEFSLVQHFKAENANVIPAAFAAKYGYPATMKAFEYLAKANRTAVPRAEWADYMAMTPWIENRKHYLANMDADFRTYGVTLATYGMRQSAQADVTATTDPWTYNPLFCNVTCRPGSDGQPSFNYAFIDDFRRIRDGEI